MTSSLLALLLVATGPTDSVPSTKVAEVVDRWEAGANLIQSYDLEVELKDWNYITSDHRIVRVANKPPSKTSRSHILRQGGKRRGEFGPDVPDSPPRPILRYDGQTYTNYNAGAKTISIHRAMICFGSSEYEDYETSYRTILGAFDRIATTRERDAKLLPRDGKLVVVEAGPSPKTVFPEMGWRLWLDPDKNYLPVKYHVWFEKQGRTLQDRDCEIDLAEVSVGVWAPVKMRTQVYAKDPDSPIFGQCMGVSELSVVREKSRFNVPLADDLFVNTIPRGTTVVDKIRNVTYTEGASDPDTYLAHLAAEGKGAVASLPAAERAAPALIFIPDDPYRSLRPILVATGAAALAVGAWAAFRIRKRKGVAG